jgi:hypothetical protein
MKAIGIGILKKLINKYGAWALSYILTKLFTFLFNRYGSTQGVIKEISEISKALDYIINTTKDGVVSEDEVKRAIPIIEEAIRFSK